MRTPSLLIALTAALWACDRQPEPAPKVAPSAPVQPAVEEPLPAEAAPSEVTKARPEQGTKNAEAEPAAAAGGPGKMVFEDETGPAGELPYRDPKDDDGFPSSAIWEFGWTEDSASFFYCNEDASDEGGTCYLVDTSGKHLEAGVPARVKQAIAEHGPFNRGLLDWDYTDIHIASHEVAFGVELSGCTVEADGSCVEGASRKILRWEFDSEIFAGADIGLGVVSLSPNGEHMAIVAMAQLGFSDEDRQAKVIATKDYAAQVYGGRGFGELKAENYERAASFFAKAQAISEAWKYPYNLACARARGGLEGVENALREAIERGGDEVKAKAKRDADLDAVREQSWFGTLIGN